MMQMGCTHTGTKSRSGTNMYRERVGCDDCGKLYTGRSAEERGGDREGQGGCQEEGQSRNAASSSSQKAQIQQEEMEMEKFEAFKEFCRMHRNQEPDEMDQ